MHLRFKYTSIAFIVLTILDLCLSVPNLADQTIINNNGNSIFSNNIRKLTANSKQLLISTINDDDIIDHSDKSETNAMFQRKNDDDDDTNNDDRSASVSPVIADDSQSIASSDSDHPNFLITNYLSDGEIERRIQFNGITAKETFVPNFRGSLSLWQLSNGETFLQMIYSYADEIMDCDFLTGVKYNEEFVQNFYNEIQRMKQYNHIDGLNEEIYHIPRFRHRSRHNVPEIDLAMDSDNEIIGARNLTYQPLFNRNDIPKDLQRFINFDEMKTECDAYHKSMTQTVNDLDSESDDVVQSATEHLNRKKRALSDWLIAPNTKWCGRGQTADKYSQLGGASKADKCCRRHDHCKFNIYAMTTKWRLFNYRPFTISHCSCDMRFRTCLKMADSADATMVGKLFFNIVQTKCFVLKPEKYCKSHSWWGACESEGTRKRAHLRNNKKF
ncbi:uncharacterized protein LOC129575320 isoform X1 [Sitodiplosis mosellana]|uniref:uncharacterized protein LOC129575320 isoform X1 n=1 Tax=Sitodiplosis mosellana TaxID=263140 RepID=UPI00244456C7|nr:uncharacterized protein LOC129575320 isoform X1 [Sitodiplosis mosellana]XP_055314670.1 uncharacterized protein LOC129575320 isoform X1 [Sitodiplosis mosellana]